MKLAKKIISIVSTIIFLLWIGVIVYDFIKFNNNEKPAFCISEKIHKYDDGTVTECTGLGYKIFNYNRDSIKKRQFGPFWTKLQQNLK